MLDIGCGRGATTIEAAVAAPAGEALGVDLSPQMIETAAVRALAADVADRTRFEVADVQTADLGPGRIDVALSRFGVMFFEDPVAAFTNIATALHPSGRIVLCCRQPLEANDWMLVPGAASAQHVPLPEAAAGTGPGPFALADPARDRSRSPTRPGFKPSSPAPGSTPSRSTPSQPRCCWPGGGTLDETVDFLVSSGSGRALLDPAPADDRQAAISAVRDTLAPLSDVDGIRLGAAAWIVTAHKPN